MGLTQLFPRQIENGWLFFHSISPGMVIAHFFGFCLPSAKYFNISFVSICLPVAIHSILFGLYYPESLAYNHRAISDLFSFFRQGNLIQELAQPHMEHSKFKPMSSVFKDVDHAILPS